MKKFEKLSRAEMKNVLGGVIDPGGGSRCSTGSCTIAVSGHGDQPGDCQTNSANKCVCAALDYPASAVDAKCVK
ncbi:bacteriocin-like protein [Mucilaginibacter flavidus]|uniref:bacteriocin-like protein n=1 Tax=Mucilaginibacter flavidus TaxID=2949309 RepID=UPI002093FF91|nr:hypothetical protein [Mucilaginibacter flavidus]MCO5945872.1 hypothetical protein [Mucilaginibacter flavidus]